MSWQATVTVRRRDGSTVVEAGGTVDRLPTRDVAWLAAGGFIVKTDPDEVD